MDLDQRSLERRFKLMIRRCYNKSAVDFKYYGQRGITICDEWLNNPHEFYRWARRSGFRRELQLDRWPNGDGPYSPSNCRWATREENLANRRPYIQHSRWHYGETQYYSAREMSKALGIDLWLVYSRAASDSEQFKNYRRELKSADHHHI